jgi:hypothetical protein
VGSYGNCRWNSQRWINRIAVQYKRKKEKEKEKKNSILGHTLKMMSN